MTNKIPINDIYYSIQGEGMLAGTPMVFLRTQGCPVGCSFCDTKETWELDKELEVPVYQDFSGKNARWASADTMRISQAVQDVWEQGTDTEGRNPDMDKWVVLTGGEPAIHDLFDLVFDLHTMGFKVALETSGTFDLGTSVFQFNWICVSPKMMNQSLPVLGSVLRQAHEIKMVVGAMKHVNQFHSLLELNEPLRDGVIISLQPMSLAKVATELCITLCKKYGWNLSIQIHQYLGIE